MADLKAEIEREVRQIRMSSMSVSNRELGAQIVALILEHRAQEAEHAELLCNEEIKLARTFNERTGNAEMARNRIGERARELRAMLK